MELQQLRYFRAAAELLHVTRAAEKLFVSQSAVSRAISQLEEELRVPLFDRRGRAVVLTRHGRTLLDHVIRAQNVLDSARQILAEESGVETGRIALGFLPSLGFTLVPNIIKEYRSKYPAVQFKLIQGPSSQDVMDRLEDGSVDLCLSVPSVSDPPGIRWTALHQEDLVVVLPQAHSLAGRRSLQLKELSQETFLVLSRDNTLTTAFEAACAEAKFAPRIGFEGMDLMTLRGMIAAGLGVGVISESPTYVDGIVEVKLSKPRIVGQLGMGWIDKRYLSPCAVAFRDFVASTLFSKSRRHRQF